MPINLPDVWGVKKNEWLPNKKSTSSIPDITEFINKDPMLNSYYVKKSDVPHLKSGTHVIFERDRFGIKKKHHAILKKSGWVDKIGYWYLDTEPFDFAVGKKARVVKISDSDLYVGSFPLNFMRSIVGKIGVIVRVDNDDDSEQGKVIKLHFPDYQDRLSCQSTFWFSEEDLEVV